MINCEFGHSCITVSDIEAEAAFYRKAIGFEIIYILRHSPERTSYFMGTNNCASLQLIYQGANSTSAPQYGHFGVLVDDIWEAHAYHSAMGCVVGSVADLKFQYCYFITDPEGYRTEIVQLKSSPDKGQSITLF